MMIGLKLREGGNRVFAVRFRRSQHFRWTFAPVVLWWVWLVYLFKLSFKLSAENLSVSFLVSTKTVPNLQHRRSTLREGWARSLVQWWNVSAAQAHWCVQCGPRHLSGANNTTVKCQELSSPLVLKSKSGSKNKRHPKQWRVCVCLLDYKVFTGDTIS